MFSLELAGDHQYDKKIAILLAFSGDVFDGVFLCCLFPKGSLG